MTEGKKYLAPEELAPRPAAGVTREGRPMAPETVTYTRQWLRYLQIGMLLVAWLVPAFYLVNRLLWPPVKRGPPTADCFIALDYTGISEKKINGEPAEVTPTRFSEHMGALIRNGYTPITLTEARDLVKGGKPVPPKSILLTMDHSRKTSYYATRTYLQHHGWNAVMFLWTKPISEADPSMLLWPYVRELVRAKNWEVGAQSENGFARIPKNALNETGHFMTTPMWLEGERRYETIEELSQRVDTDHRQCLSNIVQNTGVRPMAYAYPYGDFGQYQRQKELIKRVNLNAASRYYDMAFLTGKFGLNSRHSDPRRLNRLQVQRELTGQDLVDKLDRMWPQLGRVSLTNAQEAALSWTTDWGEMSYQEKRIILTSSSKPQGTFTPPESGDREQTTDELGNIKEQLVLAATESINGARTWLAGSDQRQDLYLHLTFQLVNGQMGVFLRGTPDEERYVYLGIDTTGGVWLRQKHAGLDPFTLASSKTHIKLQEDNVLEIFIRGALFGALLNSQPLFKENVPMLRGAPESGMIGLSVWDTLKNRAKLEISELTVSPQDPAVATWRESEIREPFYTRWIHQNGFRLTHLAPVWLSLSSAGTLSQVAPDQMLTTALAHLYRLKLLPRVEIKYDRWATTLSPAQLAYRLNEIHADGLYLDFSQLQDLKTTPLTDWLMKVIETFKDQKLQLIVQVPKIMENPARLQNILAVMPNLQLAVSGDSPIVKQGLPGAQNPPLRAVQIPEPTSTNEIPFVYQVKEQPVERDLSIPERIRILQDQGRAAMSANRFDEATNAFTRWQQLDPFNYQPVMNMGDCFLRLNNLKKANDYYTQALALDPGKISLAMRRVGYLEQLGMDAAAEKEINKYANIFPENTEVMMAQAAWLARHGQVTEARALIQKALTLKPGDIEVLVNAIRMAPTKADRRSYMRKIAALGSRPDTQIELGDALERQDLLGLPDAYLLVPTIQQIIANNAVGNTNADEQVRNAFSRFRVLTDPVREHFALGGLSENWQVDGGEAMADTHGSLMLRMNEGRHELALRLRGSELFQNGFIETELQGHNGEVWLLARRSSTDFIRLGFDQNSMLFLQVWKDGQRISNLRRQYTQIGQSIKLRLVVRGNGAMGFVNDQPAFESPVMLPQDMGYGSWGLTLNSPQPGKAQARLGMIACGPLPFIAAVFPNINKEEAQVGLLETTKGIIRDASAICPRWFQWRTEGQLERRVGALDDLITTLARFYGVKVLPAIDMAGRDSPDIDQLISLANTYRLDGFTLILPWMSPSNWIENAELKLEASSLDLLLVVPDLKGEHAAVRGVGAAARLFLTSTNNFNLIYLARGESSSNLVTNGRDNLMLMLHQPPVTSNSTPVSVVTNVPNPVLPGAPSLPSVAPAITLPERSSIIPDYGPALPPMSLTNNAAHPEARTGPSGNRPAAPVPLATPKVTNDATTLPAFTPPGVTNTPPVGPTQTPNPRVGAVTNAPAP